METEKLIQICKDRNELDFLYEITKRVAETDSIGEGYDYCDEYTRGQFERELKNTENRDYDCYAKDAGIPIYELYLKQIKAL